MAGLRSTRNPAAHAKRFHKGADEVTAETRARKDSLFLRFCDWTSAFMGKPMNIVAWFVIVASWTTAFATGFIKPDAKFLPAWFTGTAFNFPLNLVTTVAELFIGFLVAAAANRSQRVLSTIIDGIRTVLDRVEDAVTTLVAHVKAVHQLAADTQKLTKDIQGHQQRQQAQLDAIMAKLGIDPAGVPPVASEAPSDPS